MSTEVVKKGVLGYSMRNSLHEDQERHIAEPTLCEISKISVKGIMDCSPLLS